MEAGQLAYRDLDDTLGFIEAVMTCVQDIGGVGNVSTGWCRY